jgi:hypothetical protein
LEDVLVRRQVDLEEMRNLSTPWDPRSLDVARIMEMVMFYEAAGGRGYVKLAHRHRRSLDLSDHLTAGRAILIGHVNQPHASILRNGTSRTDGGRKHGTFYRILMPVDSG